MGVWTACGMNLVAHAPMCWVGGGGSAHLAGRVPVPVSRSLWAAGKLDTATWGSWGAFSSSCLRPGVGGGVCREEPRAMLPSSSGLGGWLT